jgi:hypothetical protein
MITSFAKENANALAILFKRSEPLDEFNLPASSLSHAPN